MAEGSIPVSVAIVSRNEGDMLRKTVQSVLSTLPAGGEVIVVDDMSSDQSAGALPVDGRIRLIRPARALGSAVARNWAARHARGRIVVFSDAHVEVEPGWFGPLRDALALPGVGAAGPALREMLAPACKGYGLRLTDPSLNWEWLPKRAEKPYAVPFLGGFFLAMRRQTFGAVGGFDPGFRRWGMEDMEFVLRVWCQGYRCVVVPSVEVAHLSRQRGTYPAYQLDWQTALHNISRVAVLHLSADRLRRVVEQYNGDAQLPAALARLAAGNAWLKRGALYASRARSDEWFFRRFQLGW